MTMQQLIDRERNRLEVAIAKSQSLLDAPSCGPRSALVYHRIITGYRKGLDAIAAGGIPEEVKVAFVLQGQRERMRQEGKIIILDR